MAKVIKITDDGLKKLEEELEYLKTEGRADIAEKIKVARGYGDLSENSEYDEAKNEQAKIEARIVEIACGPVPEGHARWTIRLLENQAKIEFDEPISREAIRRTLKKPA